MLILIHHNAVRHFLAELGGSYFILYQFCKCCENKRCSNIGGSLKLEDEFESLTYKDQETDTAEEN